MCHAQIAVMEMVFVLKPVGSVSVSMDIPGQIAPCEVVRLDRRGLTKPLELTAPIILLNALIMVCVNAHWGLVLVELDSKAAPVRGELVPGSATIMEIV